MIETAVVKRRDPVRTRARILAAAVETFAELGFGRAGLRDIAERADVASSLLVRYFGTKAALFEAALIETIRANAVFTWEKQDFGKTMAGLIQTRSTNAITTMLVQAFSDPRSRDVAERVWRDHIIEPLADWLGEPHALGRARSLYALMAGFTLLTQASGHEASSAETLDWQATVLQSIVDSTYRSTLDRRE